MGRILPMGRKIPLQVSFSRDDMAEQPVSYPLETVSKPASSNISLICVPCYAGVTDYAEARSVEERERHAQMKVLASKTTRLLKTNHGDEHVGVDHNAVIRTQLFCSGLLSHIHLYVHLFFSFPLFRTHPPLIPVLTYVQAIVNPFGGGGKAREAYNNIFKPMCDTLGVTVDIKETQAQGHGVILGKEAGLRYIKITMDIPSRPYACTGASNHQRFYFWASSPLYPLRC